MASGLTYPEQLVVRKVHINICRVVGKGNSASVKRVALAVHLRLRSFKVTKGSNWEILDACARERESETARGRRENGHNKEVA